MNRAVGVGSGVTGFGAGLIITDDPVKSLAEAESQTYRDNVWDWFNDDVYTASSLTARLSSSRPSGTKMTSPDVYYAKPPASAAAVRSCDADKVRH